MEHLGNTVTFSGNSYPCFPVAMRESELRRRGPTFSKEYQDSIAVLNTDVTIITRNTVTWKGTARRVLDIKDTPDGLQRILHLGKQFGGDV